MVCAELAVMLVIAGGINSCHGDFTNEIINRAKPSNNDLSHFLGSGYSKSPGALSHALKRRMRQLMAETQHTDQNGMLAKESGEAAFVQIFRRVIQTFVNWRLSNNCSSSPTRQGRLCHQGAKIIQHYLHMIINRYAARKDQERLNRCLTVFAGSVAVCKQHSAFYLWAKIIARRIKNGEMIV